LTDLLSGDGESVSNRTRHFDHTGSLWLIR
jgi:hypothetical protein